MRRISISLIAITLLLLFMLALRAQGSPYDLSWRTIDGGGGTSSGGTYILSGTIGQADAAWSSGGDYALLGGFWPGEPLCAVDFYHYARLAEHWLDTGCNELNDWCGGADLNHADGVDGVDLGLFVNEWMYYCPYDWPLK